MFPLSLSDLQLYRLRFQRQNGQEVRRPSRSLQAINRGQIRQLKTRRKHLRSSKIRLHKFHFRSKRHDALLGMQPKSLSERPKHGRVSQIWLCHEMHLIEIKRLNERDAIIKFSIFYVSTYSVVRFRIQEVKKCIK